MHIRELKAKVHMEDVLLFYDAYVDLTKTGWQSLNCPFHDDRNASASVNLDEDRFRCHGCDVGGDILDVVMAVEVMDTRDAMEFIQENIIEAS